MIKTIIFDFDGTLGDSIDAAVSVISTLGPKYGFPKVTKEEIRDNGIRGLISKYKVSPIRLPFLVNESRKELNKIIETIKPINGIEFVLRKLSKIYQIGILSSNSEQNLASFIEKNSLSQYFSFVSSNSSLFGKHISLLKLFKGRKLNRNEVIYVGDEERDIKAAKKIAILVVGVLWGYDSKEILRKQHPDFIANQPRDLIKIMQSINESF